MHSLLTSPTQAQATQAIERPSRTALIVGASGLVGGEVLKLLLETPDYTQVIALLRRPLELQHAKLQQQIIDFDSLEQTTLPRIDSVFCCLGSTLKAAGSRAACYRVDHDYVLAAARLGLVQGARHFLLVSSMGADARSPFAYMRTKGETERDVAALGYAATCFLRPAYLVGSRAQSRPLEDAYGRLMQWLAPVTPAAFRPVSARKVAQTMLRQASQATPGVHIISSARMQHPD